VLRREDDVTQILLPVNMAMASISPSPLFLLLRLCKNNAAWNLDLDVATGK
jgi:hypothetical protein